MTPESSFPGLSPSLASALGAFCAQHGVRSLRIFGSFVRNELTPESDVDVLVEFQPGVDPGLFELGGMQQDLSEIFGREVDLKTPEMFSANNLRRIIASSVLAHAA